MSACPVIGHVVRVKRRLFVKTFKLTQGGRLGFENYNTPGYWFKPGHETGS